ncbi:MAG: fibronectin type III domain-containing protein [Gemmatimonadota bacterium]|nr:fibronectin type III domain-containing protein [Gemmatimonadota bacterium]
MRPKLSVLASLAFLLVLLTLTAYAGPGGNPGPSSAVYREDINADGVVNIVDVISLLLIGRDNPGAPVADYNGDGVHSITDAISMLINIMSGNLTLIPLDPPEFYDLTLSNHTGTAAVISWRTSRETTENRVHYGYDPGNLGMVRSDTLVPVPGRFHFVQLTWLAPDTTVYYRIQSDNGQYSASPGGVDSLVTFPQRLLPQMPLLNGTVADSAGLPVETAAVRSYYKTWHEVSGSGVKVDSTMLWTSLTDETGYFWIDLSNYRTTSGLSLFYIPGQTWLHLEILEALEGTVWQDSVLLSIPQMGSQDLGTIVVP